MRMRVIALVALILIVITEACAPATPTAPAEPTTSPTPHGAKPPAERSDPVELAREALAQHAGVPVERVEVVDSTRDVFPMDNLGCPGKAEEDMTRPGIVAGVEVTLRIEDEVYVYRVYGRRTVLCREPETG